MDRRRQQRRNKREDDVYCFLCGYEAENRAAFKAHLEELRHMYNFKLTEFKVKRYVCSVVLYPILFVYRTGKLCHFIWHP
jgi:hypothetical protein